MKYILLFLISVFVSGSAFSQVTVVDTPHCLNHTLFAEVTGGIIPTASGITADDGWSGVIPIGFTYNFYGVPNTQCIIGSNGCLGFNLAYASAAQEWLISANLASTTYLDMRNVICGPWCDIYIPAGGTIDYSTQGVAPNRNFAVTFCGTAMYSCTTEWITTQIIIYESTGIAEVHIGHRTICLTGWNSQAAIVGVKNAAGTVSTVAPGRDYPTVWAATNEAWRFTPAGTTYTVSSIPYSPIPYAASAIYWYDSTTGAYLGTGPTVSVSPTVTTTYVACALGCNDTVKSYIHVTPSWLVVGGIGGLPYISGITSANPTVCGECNGSITIHGVRPFTQDSVIYSLNGVPQPVLLDSAGADSTITISGLCAGTLDYIFYKIMDCPSNQVGPVTLTTPPLSLAMNYSIKLGCNGDLVTFNDLSAPTGTDYITTWSFGDGTAASNAVNASHVFANPGYTGVYTDTLTYSTSFGCSIDTVFTVNVQHPISANYTSDAQSVCLNTPNKFYGSTINLNEPSYTWNFGDDRPVVNVPANGANNATDTVEYESPVAGFFTATLTVTDTIGCQAKFSDTFNVISIDINTSVHDTSVCLADSMTLRALPADPKKVVTPWYIPFSYSWAPTNNIGQTTAATTNFMGLGTYVYTVTVTTTQPLVLNPFGCTASDTEEIISYPPVSLVNLTQGPVTIPFGGSVQLNVSGAVYYTWTPTNGTLDNPNINDPVATPTDPYTIYTVYGRNLYGCTDSANIPVYVDLNMKDLIPTAFTPNGDGLNDLFRITNLKYQKLVDFSVFNRWGILVFHTNNPEVGWDGTYQGVAQDMGVYNYQIITAHPDGTNQTYKGNVTLIR